MYSACVKQHVSTCLSDQNKKSNNKQRGQYSIKEVRLALIGMLEGKSARQMEEHYRIPRSNLMRYFKSLADISANSTQSLSKLKIASLMEDAKDFYPPKVGECNKYFTHDEEEMFICMLEEAHNCAFPYDKDALKAMVSRSGQGSYGKVCLVRATVGCTCMIIIIIDSYNHHDKHTGFSSNRLLGS